MAGPARMKTCNAIVVESITQPLSALSNHADVDGITRRLFCSALLAKSAPVHIAVHNFDGKFRNKSPGRFVYTEPHAHNVWEFDLVIPLNKNFLFQLETDNKLRFIRTASTLLIPPRVRHRMEIIRGQGTMICIVCSGNYARSLLKSRPTALR